MRRHLEAPSLEFTRKPFRELSLVLADANPDRYRNIYTLLAGELVAWGARWLSKTSKKESSFSEEKEAKRLLFLGRLQVGPQGATRQTICGQGCLKRRADDLP
jgi:hypothetical protein